MMGRYTICSLNQLFPGSSLPRHYSVPQMDRCHLLIYYITIFKAVQELTIILRLQALHAGLSNYMSILQLQRCPILLRVAMCW